MSESHFPQLETERLTLGEIEPTLVDDVFLMYSNPQVCRYLPFPAFTTREEAASLIESWLNIERSGAGYRWCVRLLETTDFLGFVGLRQWDRRVNSAELTFALRPERWGSGYMREAILAVLKYAFPAMKLRRLTAYVDPNDIRAQNLLLGLNFKIEGIMRGHDVIRGEYVDDMIFGLLSDEWSGVPA